MTQQNVNCLVACCMGILGSGVLIVFLKGRNREFTELFYRLNCVEKKVARMEGEANERDKRKR